mgnify:CR=1 FL=1
MSVLLVDPSYGDDEIGRVALAMDLALFRETGGTLPDNLFLLMARAAVQVMQQQERARLN